MTDESPAGNDRGSLHFVSETDELPPGDRVLVEVEGLEILVVNVDGEYHAIGNYCVHQSGPLSDGFLSGRIDADMSGDGWEYRYECDDRLIACPWHGWQFDVTSGEHVGSDSYRVPTFETVEEDGAVFVRF